MKVWVLTSEVNAYDQYGEYFEDVYKEKPTEDQISDKMGYKKDSKQVQNLMNKGSSYVSGANGWYKLKQKELK